jgi:hypothetical protein
LDPEAWLRYVPTQIADHPASGVVEFFPWNSADKLADA